MDETRRDGGADTGFSTTRTEAYTDGVFAIAATLLVLDLTTASFGEIQSDDQLWAALVALSPKFTSFAVSFVLLSGMWMIHMRQFRDLRAVDAPLLWLNNARLLFVVLIPFATALTSEYPDLAAGRVLLPLDFFFVALFGQLSWQWGASRGGHLMGPDADDRRASSASGGIAALACAAIAVALSPWFGPWAFLAFVLNGPLAALLLRLARRRAQGRAGAAG